MKPPDVRSHQSMPRHLENRPFILTALRVLDQVAEHSTLDATTNPVAKPPVVGSGVYIGLAGHAWVYLHLWLSLQQDATLRAHMRAALRDASPAGTSPWGEFVEIHDDEQARGSLRWLLEKAQDLARKALEAAIAASARGRLPRMTLLEGGVVGPLVVLVMTHEALGELDAAIAALHALIEFGERNVLSAPPDASELLYGRAGYLSALQHARAGLLAIHRRQKDKPLRAAMREALRDLNLSTNAVIHQLFQEGAKNGNALEYRWYDTVYFGCAHGLAGIVHVILDEIAFVVQARSAASLADGYDPSDFDALFTPDRLARVRQSVRQLIAHQLPSGNLEATDDSPTSDRLVQWCHGAPGLIFTIAALLRLSRWVQELGSNSSMEWAQGIHRDLCIDVGSPEFASMERAMDLAGDNVGLRGMSAKGVGLCHGVSGHIYAVLRLHRYYAESGNTYPRDGRWLRYAQEFAKHLANGFTCQSIGEALPDLLADADRPWSLYEGAAAVPCALLDVVAPLGARQPGFEVWGPLPVAPPSAS